MGLLSGRLPNRLREQAEVVGVEFEDRPQEPGDREEVLSVADLLEDVPVEPLGGKLDALLLACGTEKRAFTGTCKNDPVAAVPAARTGKAAMEVAAVRDR